MRSPLWSHPACDQLSFFEFLSSWLIMVWCNYSRELQHPCDQHGQTATHGTRQNFTHRRKTAEWQTLILWSSDAVTSSCPRAVKQSWFTAALWPHTLPTYNSNGNHNLQQVWFGLLVFNGTFSTNRLHRALGVWNINCVGPGKHIQLTTCNSTVKFSSIATVSPLPLPDRNVKGTLHRVRVFTKCKVKWRSIQKWF